MDKADEGAEVVNMYDTPTEPADDSASAKKKFVAPQISVPVDVLEATTFFQLADSGSTP